MRTIPELEQIFARDRFVAPFDVRITDLTETSVTIVAPVSDSLLNGNDVVQGGALYTLSDYTFSVHANAIHCPSVTASGSINYIHPARGDYLKAIATLKGQTRRTFVYSVEVFDDRDVLVALAEFSGAKLDVRTD